MTKSLSFLAVLDQALTPLSLAFRLGALETNARGVTRVVLHHAIEYKFADVRYKRCPQSHMVSKIDCHY